MIFRFFLCCRVVPFWSIYTNTLALSHNVWRYVMYQVSHRSYVQDSTHLTQHHLPIFFSQDFCNSSPMGARTSISPAPPSSRSSRACTSTYNLTNTSPDPHLAKLPGITLTQTRSSHLDRRYTSFALESIQCTFSGSIGFGKRTTVRS